MADKQVDVSFKILCSKCNKEFTYHPITEEGKAGITKEEDDFVGMPCPYCDAIWNLYSRVKTMEPFEIENILVEPRSMQCGTEQ